MTPFQVQQSRLAVDLPASALIPSFESQQAGQILGVANFRPEGYAVQLNNHQNRVSKGTIHEPILSRLPHLCRVLDAVRICSGGRSKESFRNLRSKSPSKSKYWVMITRGHCRAQCVLGRCRTGSVMDSL